MKTKTKPNGISHPIFYSFLNHGRRGSFLPQICHNSSSILYSQFHILLIKGIYLVWRPWAKIWPVFFFLNSTLITAIVFPTRRTLPSISISSSTYAASKHDTLISTETPELHENPAVGTAVAPTRSTKVVMAPPCKQLLEFSKVSYMLFCHLFSVSHFSDKGNIFGMTSLSKNLASLFLPELHAYNSHTLPCS